MTLDGRELQELLDLAQLDGPLPEGVEDRLWGDVADVYRRLAAGGAGGAEIIELRSAPVDARPPQRRWSAPAMLGAAAAAVAILVGGLLVLLDDEQSATSVSQVSRWVDDFGADHASLVTELADGIELQDRTASAGHASLLPYLDAISAGTERALVTLRAAPADPRAVGIAADEYATSLAAWATAARQLETDLSDLQDEFTFEPGLLDDRLSGLRDLEVAALDQACSTLRSEVIAAFDVGESWITCDALTPEFE